MYLESKAALEKKDNFLLDFHDFLRTFGHMAIFTKNLSENMNNNLQGLQVQL